MGKEEPGQKAIATNRKAFFNYEVLDRFEAGVSLVGTEVKSIREGGLNFRDSYVEFRGGELFLVGCRIGPYSHGNMLNHAEWNNPNVSITSGTFGQISSTGDPRIIQFSARLTF